MKNLFRVLISLIFLTCALENCMKDDIPDVTTADVRNILDTSAICGGTIIDEGSSSVFSRGVCWSIDTIPTIADSKTEDGIGVGSFSSKIIGLIGATTYYVRAYATNNIGTGYGVTIPFETLGSKPAIINVTAINIKDTFATLSAKVNANHLLTNFIFEYGQEQLNIQSDPIIIYDSVDIEVSTKLLNLTSTSEYHFRLRAQNSAGTTYSPEYSFYTNGNFLDIENNVYPTVNIGSQLWMAKNLQVTKYRNGEQIINVIENSDWSNSTFGAYCYYNNDPDNYSHYYKAYGPLYNFYAISDSRNLCPVGWHIPSDAEWKTLEMFLGMSQTIADKLGSRGTDQGMKLKATNLDFPSWNGSNSSGFGAAPGGLRDSAGQFRQNGSVSGGSAVFWTSEASNSLMAYARQLHSMIMGIHRDEYSKKAGFSVRCIKD